MNVSKLAPYAKAVVAVGGVILLIAKAFVDGHVSFDELFAVLTASGVSVGVFQVTNEAK